jgi:hypothetical protein
MSSGHGIRRFKKAAQETARGNPKERRTDNKDQHEERVKGWTTATFSDSATNSLNFTFIFDWWG